MCKFWNVGPWPSWFLSRTSRPMGLLLLTWDSMGVKISKRYSSYKSQPKVLKLFLNVLPNVPHENTFGIFQILKLKFKRFLLVLINMGPNRSENFKTLLLLQVAAKSFETCPEFSFQWLSRKKKWNF